LFVFNPFPGFKCIVIALKSRTVALKTRTKFGQKLVRVFDAKVATLGSCRRSGLEPGSAVRVGDRPFGRANKTQLRSVEVAALQLILALPQPLFRPGLKYINSFEFRDLSAVN